MKRDTPVRRFPWSFSDIVLIVVLGGGGIALLIWLESFHRWWAQALGEYLVFFLMTGAGVGAYGGWALDDIDDDAEERKVGWQLVAIAMGIPLLLVLGKHAYTTSVDAPGAWPRAADLTARLLVAAAIGVAALLVANVMARRRPLGSALWTSGLSFLAALGMLAAWPWLGSEVPSWLRGVVLVILLVVGVAAVERVPR